MMKKTSSRMCVELGSAAVLDDVFTIQNSHITIFQHNGLVYFTCGCGKLNNINQYHQS